MKKDIRKNLLPEGEIIPLKYDFMFAQIFNNPENIEIVEGFISSYFDMPLEKVHNKIEIKSRKLDIENKKEANNEVDLLLELDNKKKINIEISTDVTQGIIDRNVVFLSKVHSKNIEYGMKNYEEIYPSIQINLVSHKINKKEIIERYYIRNEEGEILTENFRIDYIDMAKAIDVCYNEVNKKEKIIKWCQLIMSNKKDEFEKTLKESNIMSEKAKKKLSTDVEKISEDEDTVIIYTKLSKWEMEHNTIIKEAQMAKENAEKALKEGMQKGIEQGINKRNIEIAKNLLLKNIDVEIISETTGLTKEEVEKLKENV